MNRQLTLLDFDPKEDHGTPELVMGQRIYKAVLSEIHTGEISHIWECEANQFHDFFWGYSAKKDGVYTYVTFWSPDIGKSVFLSREEAERKAESNRNQYALIRKEDMHPIKTYGYRRKIKPDEDLYWNMHVTILDGMMVYSKKAYEYPFLLVCKTEEELNKAVKILRKEIENDRNGEVETIDVEPEFHDMYLTVGGRWSSSEYAEHNGAVPREGNNITTMREFRARVREEAI